MLLNSYTLKTLEGLPLTGIYNTRCLHAFTPHVGTKLVTSEMEHMETIEEEGGTDKVADSEEM